MNTYFSLTINSIPLDFISMNVTGPKLFQVFATVNGEKRRFHMQGNDTTPLEFTHRNDCPKLLLDIESQIREEIFRKYLANHR